MTAAAADALAAVHSGQIKLEKLGPAAVDAYLDAGLVQQPGFWPLAWGPAWSEEADILAVQYLWNAGIDPRGLAQLLERLSAGGETDSGLFDAGQTRDELANRVARIRDFAGQFLPPRSDLAADSQAFQQVAQQLPPANVRRPGSGLAEIRKGIVQIAESITRSYVARAVLAAVPAGE